MLLFLNLHPHACHNALLPLGQAALLHVSEWQYTDKHLCLPFLLLCSCCSSWLNLLSRGVNGNWMCRSYFDISVLQQGLQAWGCCQSWGKGAACCDLTTC